MDYGAIWQAALGDLQLQMTKATFDTWLRDTSVLHFQNSTLTIAVRNAYAKEWLENRLLPTIRRTLARVAGEPLEVDFAVRRRIVANATAKLPEESSRDRSRPATTNSEPRLELNGKYTFANFVVGSSNRMAHAAALAAAENPALAYNPLFVYGGVGLGKTHLLHAIAHHARSRQKGLSVLYVSSECFTNDLIEAIRRSSTEAFRQKYRQIDILLIDDIQFLAGKESTQEEFFHTFNTLHSAGRQIVVSSDRPPRSIPTLEDRLRSRFEGGLIADIQPPDIEMRTAILQTKNEAQELDVPPEVVGFIAARITGNIRDMEGALTRVAAYARIMLKRPPTPELAAEILEDMTMEPTAATPQEIIRAVASFYGVRPEDLLGNRRSRALSMPRQVAMYLLREDSRISFPQIGQELGGRDHTTAIYGFEKITSGLAKDERLRQDIAAIRQRMRGVASR